MNYRFAYRPNYDVYAAATWAGFALVAVVVPDGIDLPAQPFQFAALFCTVLAAVRVVQAALHARRLALLRGRPLWFLGLRSFRRLLRRVGPEMLYLGHGFDWGQPQAQAAFDIGKRDVRTIAPPRAAAALGAGWLHGIGADRERPLTLPLSHAMGHTLIVGTTGAGKTRLFDLLIAQRVLAGDTVIVIDPKGDRDLARNARRACALAGDESRFRFFHPAFPERSVRIDPMANFRRPTELASRIAALIQTASGSEGDPFKAFSQMALTQVVTGLVGTGQQPNLLAIKRYLQGSVEELLDRLLSDHFRTIIADWDRRIPEDVRTARNVETRVAKLVAFYRRSIQSHPEWESPPVEELLQRYEHNREHYSKMIASLMPIMSQLTNGVMAELLSPRRVRAEDQGLSDTQTMIRRAEVVYLGLDTLTDGFVGKAIGSILLADLTAVAGERYNYGVSNRAVSVFVDEAAEVVCDPFINLLNKGRGANVRLFLATQTLGDFAAKLGSTHKTRMVLGNCNNLIALRIKDGETQEYVAEALPRTRLNYLMHMQSASTLADAPMLYSAGATQRLMEEDAPLVPPAYFGALPNLEFFAYLSGADVVKGRLPILRWAEDRP